jgi:predicted esterase
MHIIYSDRIKGIGFHEGGPYYSTILKGYLLNQTSADEISQSGIRAAELNQDYGLIDNLSNIKDSPVYIIGGEFDTTVPLKVQESANLFYEHYKANVIFDIQPFEH